MSGNIFNKRCNQTCILLCIYILFLFLRAPDILIQGRFWAEEGNIFYTNAYNMNPLRALLVVYGGYINLGASATTLIARYLYIPLEFAPYFTTFIGLFFQITPIYILLTAKDAWLSPFRIRLLATLLLLFVPESSEISLQSLHIQFHLTLACTFIAFLQTEIKYQRYFKLTLLIIAPLCGLLPIFLTPIFLFQWVKEKTKIRLEQLCALSIGGLVQLSFYIYNIKYNIDLNSVSIVRQGHFSFNDLCSVFYIRDLVFPFLGHRTPYAVEIMNGIFHKVEIHQFSIIACLIFSGFTLIISAIFIKHPKTRPALLIFITAILTLCVAIYGVIGGTVQLIQPYFSERYTFLSQALLAIMLLYFSITLPKIGKVITNIIILWVLIVGTINFFHPFPETSDGAGHVWKQELEKWKQDPNYHPKIWCSGWYIIIPEQLSSSSKTLQK